MTPVVKIEQSMSGRYLFGQLFSKLLKTSGNDASHPSEMTHEDETPVIKANLSVGGYVHRNTWKT